VYVTRNATPPNRGQCATVNGNGVVTMKSAGVATISVTVNGVIGTTPIVVQ
jgi:hypothetical protein